MNQHWNEVRLKEYAQILLSNIDKKNYDGEKPVLLCNYTDVYYNKTIHKDIKFMLATASEAQIKKLTLKYNDVIITKDSESADDIGIPAIVKHTEQNLVCGYHLAIIRSKKLDGNYINYLFQSKVAKEYFLEVCLGFTRVSLNKGDILNFKFNMPSLNEQTKIANYLDSETSKIDRKISILEQKYEKLEEYKQSVIFETVTKGLDSNVEMKDSGIDWIGEIPKYWEVKRVKECINKTISGGTPLANNAEMYDENGTPWVVIGDLTNNEIIFDTKNKVSSKGILDKNLKIIPKGTLLYSMYASVGYTSFLGIESTINQAILALFIKNILSSKFLKYSLDAYRPRILQEATGTTQVNLNAEKVKNIKILVPTKNVQDKIASYLDVICFKVYKKKEIINKQIKLLKEYKQTIIYEAVTGKMEIL